MLEEGERPPSPSRAGTRTTQVNVRLTAEEKVLLEATARRKGYSGLSDFIRAAAIESARQGAAGSHPPARPRRAIRGAERLSLLPRRLLC